MTYHFKSSDLRIFFIKGSPVFKSSDLRKFFIKGDPDFSNGPKKST